MRSKLLFLIMLIVALAAFCGTASANLIPNPGMEDPCSTTSPTVTADDPTDWWEWGSDFDGDGPSIEEYRNDKIDGTTEARSWKMYAHVVAPGPADYANILPPNAPVEEGKVYYAGIYVKDIRPGGSLTDVGIEFLYFDAAGTRITAHEHVESASVPNNGEYNLISGESIPVPVGIASIVIGFNSGNSSEYNIDDFYLDTTRLAGSSGVRDPYPADEAIVAPPTGSFPSAITLKWRKQLGQKGDELIIDTVWWNAGAADVNDNNFDPPGNGSSLVHTEPNTAAAVIDAEKNYVWRVDVIDPNGGNGGALPPVLPGPVWSFSTVNSPPAVDAGIKQAKWMDSSANPITFQLAPTVSDDGLPVPPSTLSYQWTDSGGVVYSPDATTKDATATMDTAGDYILTLTVSDDGAPASGDPCDTVLLRVHANTTTGLEARYDMDEGGGAPGVHDDYSGVVKNPTGTVGSYDYSNGTRRGERMVTAGELNTAAAGTTATTMDTSGGHCDDGDGPNQGAIVFDGGEGFVLVSNSRGDPNDNEWSPGPTRTWADFENEVSVAAWIKIADGDSKPWQSIICNGNTSYRLQLSGNGSTVNFAVSGASTANVSGSTGVNDGTWHHVMGTYDGTKIALYVDGLEENSADSDGTIDIGNDWLTIGHNLGAINTDVDGDGIRDGDDVIADTTFNGVMDEVRIHSIGLPWQSDNPGNPETAPVTSANARSVVSIYRTSCGHDNCGGNYLPGDLDESCYVDLADAKIMAGEWLDCSSIDRAFCDDFWIP